MEKKPAPEEKEETKVLQVPSASVCGVSTDTEGDSLEDLKSEAKIQEMKVRAKTSLNFLLLNLYSCFIYVFYSIVLQLKHPVGKKLNFL